MPAMPLMPSPAIDIMGLIRQGELGDPDLVKKIAKMGSRRVDIMPERPQIETIPAIDTDLGSIEGYEPIPEWARGREIESIPAVDTKQVMPQGSPEIEALIARLNRGVNSMSESKPESEPVGKDFAKELKADPLTESARKAVAEGRTVEEFVKGRGEVVYHGTPDISFKLSEMMPGKGKVGIYFSSDKKIADEYQARRGMWISPNRTGKEGTIEAYLDMKNPLIIDAMGARYDNIPTPWHQWKQKVYGNLPKESWTIEKVVAKAKELGYDGVVVKNVMDAIDTTDRKKSNVSVVFDSFQIKTTSDLRAAYDKAKAEAGGKVTPFEKSFALGVVTPSGDVFSAKTIGDNHIQVLERNKLSSSGVAFDSVLRFMGVPKPEYKEAVSLIKPENIQYVKLEGTPAEKIANYEDEYPMRSLADKLISAGYNKDTPVQYRGKVIGKLSDYATGLEKKISKTGKK